MRPADRRERRKRRATRALRVGRAQVLSGLLEERLPELHRHFAAAGFDPGIVTTSWFITLFMECCPLEVRARKHARSSRGVAHACDSCHTRAARVTGRGVRPQTVFRIWDILFCEGSKTLFAVALAIFRDIAAELTAIRDPGLLGSVERWVAAPRARATRR